MDISYIFFSLAMGIIWGAIGSNMSLHRNRSSQAGFWLGFFLGVIGLAVIALMGPKDNT